MIVIGTGKYEKWLRPENLQLIKSWAKNGLSDADIAKNIGISKETFYRWVRIYSDFSDALRIGKDSADAIIENQLFKLAKGGSFPAIKYWLTCRKPDKWCEKVVAEKAASVIYETEDTSDVERLIYGE